MSGRTLGAINRYDEYGIPQSSNIGRFQYTGQAWLPEIGMYYYKARIYSPTLGRFLQTDPIGYGDGMNIYAYVGNDPVNGSDPNGLTAEITVTGKVPSKDRPPFGVPLSLVSSAIGFDSPLPSDLAENLVIGKRIRPVMLSISLSNAISMACLDGNCPTDGIVTGDLGDLFITITARKSPRFQSFIVGQYNNHGTSKTKKERNYCGGEGSVELPNWNWNSSCKRHDDCYRLQLGRARCDLLFGVDILVTCTEQTYFPPYCATAAILGSALVGIGGGPFYRKD